MPRGDHTVVAKFTFELQRQTIILFFAQDLLKWLLVSRNVAPRLCTMYIILRGYFTFYLYIYTFSIGHWYADSVRLT